MATKIRSTAWRLSLAATATGCALSSTAALAQTSRDPLAYQPTLLDDVGARRQVVRRAPEQRFTLRPSVGVRTLVTDNVYLTSSNKTADIVVNPFVGVVADLTGPRTSLSASLDAGYDSYSRAHQQNGFTFRGVGTGDYDIVPQLLRFEAGAAVTTGNISSFGTPAFDRSGVAGRTQIINLSAGPRLTTTIGEIADLEALARVGWVGFSEADGSTTIGEPEDSTTREISIGATTGDRYRSHEIRLSATYEADDNDFRRYSGLASVFVPVTSNIRVLARAGADDIYQPFTVDLQAPAWSVGLEYEFNVDSYVRIEGGRRYHDNNFAAESLIYITDRFALVGSYVERIQPPQIGLNDSFLGFVANSQTFPPPLANQEFSISGPLYNETSKSKDANVYAVYTWPYQQISVGAQWSRSHFLRSDTFDEYVVTSATYSRRMRPDLRGDVSVEYRSQLADQTFGGSDSWGGRVRLTFDLNTSVQITGGYAYSNDHQTGVGGQRVKENVAFAALRKSF